jgi:hypothetical protein
MWTREGGPRLTGQACGTHLCAPDTMSCKHQIAAVLSEPQTWDHEKQEQGKLTILCLSVCATKKLYQHPFLVMASQPTAFPQSLPPSP